MLPESLRSPLALGARQLRRTAKQIELELQLQGKMLVKIGAGRIGGECAPRLKNGAIDHRQVLLDDAHRRAVELGAVLLERALELGNRLVVAGIEADRGIGSRAEFAATRRRRQARDGRVRLAAGRLRRARGWREPRLAGSG